MSVLIYATHGHISFPFEGSAGLTRGTVRVEFTGLPDSFRVGEVLPGTVSLRTAGMTAILEHLPDRETQNLVVVVLHSGSAGTFRQIGVAKVEPRMSVSTDLHPGMRWEAASSSGGASIYAAVVVLKPEDAPLTIVTSGYLGRSGWKVHTIAPSGAVEVKPYSEYVAKHTPAEIL
jgi:hypothetical protein